MGFASFWNLLYNASAVCWVLCATLDGLWNVKGDCRASKAAASTARSEMTGFFCFTVHARDAVIVFCVAFVVLGLAQPMLIGCGIVDLLGTGFLAGLTALRDKTRFEV